MRSRSYVLEKMRENITRSAHLCREKDRTHVIEQNRIMSSQNMSVERMSDVDEPSQTDNELHKTRVRICDDFPCHGREIMTCWYQRTLAFVCLWLSPSQVDVQLYMFCVVLIVRVRYRL